MPRKTLENDEGAPPGPDALGEAVEGPWDLTRFIPHRPPFLFVDEVVQVGEDWVKARFTPPAQAPFFAGHYPGNPIMPGVLLCEAVFQVAAFLLVYRGRAVAAENKVPVLCKVQQARFRQMIRPGQELALEARLQGEGGGFFMMEGKAYSQERLVLSLEYTLGLVEPAQP